MNEYHHDSDLNAGGQEKLFHQKHWNKSKIGFISGNSPNRYLVEKAGKTIKQTWVNLLILNIKVM
jgi:hypothetical protein